MDLKLRTKQKSVCNTFQIKLLYISLIIAFFSSCMHRVSLSKFPSEKVLIDYEKIQLSQKSRNEDLKSGGKQEYFFQITYDKTEELVLDISKQIVEMEGFKPILSDTDQDYMVFEKGLSPEAWKSMIGIYYDIDTESNQLKMYILYQMTQDYTGSFDFNYAEAFGQRIQQSLIERS